MALHKCDECGQEISTSAMDTVADSWRPPERFSSEKKSLAEQSKENARNYKASLDAQGQTVQVGSKCPNCLAPHRVAFATYYERLRVEAEEKAEEQQREKEQIRLWVEEKQKNSNWFYACPRCLKKNVNPYEERMCCPPDAAWGREPARRNRDYGPSTSYTPFRGSVSALADDWVWHAPPHKLRGENL